MPWQPTSDGNPDPLSSVDPSSVTINVAQKTIALVEYKHNASQKFCIQILALDV